MENLLVGESGPDNGKGVETIVIIPRVEWWELWIDTVAGSCPPPLVLTCIMDFDYVGIMDFDNVCLMAKAAVEVEANVPSSFSLASIADDANLQTYSANMWNEALNKQLGTEIQTDVAHSWDYYFSSREHTLKFDSWEELAELEYVKEQLISVGNDAHGNLLADALRDDGVCLDYLTVVPSAPAGHAVVMLQSSGQNSIVIVGGANMSCWPQILPPQHLEVVSSAGIVLLQREIPDFVNVQVAKAARNAGVPVIFDAGGMDEPIPQELLDFVDIFSPNESELARLTGLPTESFEEIKQAAVKCHKLGVKQVLVKLGSKGSALFIEEEPIQQPAIFAKIVIDMTGAGDTFTAAFAVALVEGKSKKECLRFASMCAEFILPILAKEVTIRGSRNRITVHGIEKTLENDKENNFSEEAFLLDGHFGVVVRPFFNTRCTNLVIAYDGLGIVVIPGGMNGKKRYEVEALSPVVSTVAESVRARAIVDVGAGQVELHFLLITVLLVKLLNLVVLSTLTLLL
ncbi:ribokinase [Trifolium repens]|nr:ribokinase [Trifolium repens]